MAQRSLREQQQDPAPRLADGTTLRRASAWPGSHSAPSSSSAPATECSMTVSTATCSSTTSSTCRPYAGTAGGVAPYTLSDTLHNPWYAAAQTPLAWTPRTVSGPAALCPGGLVCGFANSDLTYTSDSPVMGHQLPRVQQYSLDFQYEVAHGLDRRRRLRRHP